MSTRDHEWKKFVAAPVPGVQALHAYFNKHAYERHSHDYFVLGTVDLGAPKFGLENRSFLAPAGTAMVINPGQPHDGRPSDDKGYVYSMVYVDPQVIDDIAIDLGFSQSSPISFSAPVVNDPDVVFALKKLHRSLFSGEDVLTLEDNLINALTPLLQRYSGRKVQGRAAYSEPRVERARQLIHSSFFDALTTADLAAAADLSRVHLNKLFTAAYGLPLHTYLNAVRLEAAKEMILAGHGAAEIAAAVGLSDQSHLIRRFKGKFGITPAQFKAAHLSDIQYRS